MRSILTKNKIGYKLVIILIMTFLFSETPSSKTNFTYDLTVKVVEGALKGWKLYQNGKFVSQYNGGKYTDPKRKMKGYEFWSNGKYAKYDRDNNGHFETVFFVQEKRLVYIGSIGSKSQFIHVANKYKMFLTKPMSVIFYIENRKSF